MISIRVYLLASDVRYLKAIAHEQGMTVSDLACRGVQKLIGECRDAKLHGLLRKQEETCDRA